MAECNINFEDLLGVEKPTDIEIVLYILRLMDGYLQRSPGYKNRSFERDHLVKLAEKTLKTITNPHAKKLLMDKIDEFH